FGVVRDEEIHPAVVIVIKQRDAQSFACGIVETGARGDVFKTAVAAIVIERGALAFVRLRRAVRLVFAVERAEEICLRRPVDVVADEEIELAVVVIVEPGGARGKTWIADAGGFGYVEKLAAAEVVEEMVWADAGDVDVGVAVVVVVSRGDADAIHFGAEA